MLLGTPDESAPSIMQSVSAAAAWQRGAQRLHPVGENESDSTSDYRERERKRQMFERMTFLGKEDEQMKGGGRV